jgi:hypothetical protein
MIKSADMNHKILLIFALLLVLSGCSSKELSAVQRFQGETVATLQTMVSQDISNVVTMTTTLTLQVGQTPQPDEPIKTSTPDVFIAPIATNTPTVAQAYPVVTSTLSPAVQYPEETPTVTPPVVNPDWSGLWNAWYQNQRGDYEQFVLSIQVIAGKLTGSATIESLKYDFTGVILENGGQVKGDWVSTQENGTFWWRILSDDIFAGSRDNRFGFCGNRENPERPDHCRELPPE